EGAPPPTAPAQPDFGEGFAVAADHGNEDDGGGCRAEDDEEPQVDGGGGEGGDYRSDDDDGADFAEAEQADAPSTAPAAVAANLEVRGVQFGDGHAGGSPIASLAFSTALLPACLAAAAAASVTPAGPAAAPAVALPAAPAAPAGPAAPGVDVAVAELGPAP